jgi:hypothetical protein
MAAYEQRCQKPCTSYVKVREVSRSRMESFSRAWNSNTLLEIIDQFKTSFIICIMWFSILFIREDIRPNISLGLLAERKQEH